MNNYQLGQQVYIKIGMGIYPVGEGTNSVGIVRLDLGFCQTRVISWLRLIERKLNLKREQKEFEKRSDGNK